MNEQIMAICDKEEYYACRMQEYFQKRKLPYRIQVFTQKDEFNYFYQENKITILIMSQSFYQEEMEEAEFPNLYLLKENKDCPLDSGIVVSKYQSAEQILKQIVVHYSESNRTFFEKEGIRGYIIGVYTPVKRCLQTSFSVLLGQLLSKKKKALYLNLEGYSGFALLTGKKFRNDLSDLLYTMRHAPDKVIARLYTMVENVGGLDFIPPTASIRDLEETNGVEIGNLIQKIAKESHYDYIIVDISDCLQGVFSLLKDCDRIYTITPTDGIGMAKIREYEQALADLELEEVLKKTKKCEMPKVTELPSKLQELLQTELAEYVKEMIKEEFYEAI